VRFVDFDHVADLLRGRSVAIVGSAPSCATNAPGFVDSHDVVVRVNNYRTGAAQGYRADVHYAFYGHSIKKTREELMLDGVTLCMNKCPNDRPIESAWHVRKKKEHGIDFRWIYQHRAPWWFCDTFVPSTESFMLKFQLLDRHVPTTGFAAVLDVLACEPGIVYLTGFDFFTSKKHNVTDNWKPGDPDDPIGHRPMLEAAWLKANARNHPIMLDPHLRTLLLEAA